MRTHVHATGTPRLLRGEGTRKRTTGCREGAGEATTVVSLVHYALRHGIAAAMELFRHVNRPVRLRELEADPSRAP